MDPLSAIASVVGIISAASQVAAVLGPYARAGKEAPKIVAQLHSETVATKTVLAALEQLTMVLSKMAAISSITYASLIQIDELRAVLTDGVLLFSELEALVDTLPPLGASSQGARLLASIQWTRKRGALFAVLARLQSFKVSINCILSILQSDSQARAESHQQQLIQNVNEILRNSQTLTQMMLGADDVATTLLDAPRPRASIESPSTPLQIAASGVNALEPRDDRRPRMSVQSTRSLYSMMHFETELKGSRVYRLAKRMSMDFSMRSSFVGTHAWSVFSGLSLGEISNISVLALPIYASDITNPQHYHFGPTMSTVKEDVAPAVDVDQWHFGVLTRLSQLSLYPFASLVAEEKRKATSASKDNSLSTLIAVFRHGLPLLAILDHFDDSLHDEWDSLSSETWMQYRPGTVGEAAVSIFTQACVDHLSLTRSECFTISELMDSDINGQIKVANVIRTILDKLEAMGKISYSAPDSLSNQDSPYFIFFNTYLSDQWLYLSRLEDLLAVKEKLPPPGIPLTANEIQALEYLFTHLSALVDIQRRFLLGLENADLIPYRYLNRYLNRVFREWIDAWGEPFVGFLTCRDPGESAAQTLRQSANRELQGLLGDGLRLVDRSEWPFLKHKKFLEVRRIDELTKSHETPSKQKGLPDNNANMGV
ncbi:hypothetical protein B0T19DRAFT_186010 [Cercophora scortea]|uniref:Cdc24/Scd1 N-terminal domain-containing protein n=1 Tax=Cercophora scortea TaxID=314031 RepID=A0AAE0MDI9_9PEZI|nr:hypothetical protein B0T19DRAFT_186010 [Cercophora scortea]